MRPAAPSRSGKRSPAQATSLQKNTAITMRGAPPIKPKPAMKKLISFTIFFLSAGLLSSQVVPLSSLLIQSEPGSLQVSNGDSSYIFHAYVLTQELNGIDSLTLASENFLLNTWTPAKDTLYSWNLVLNDSLLASAPYHVCKPNSNLLQVCLGRLYFSTRHRFTFTVTGANGILTKEFIF